MVETQNIASPQDIKYCVSTGYNILRLHRIQQQQQQQQQQQMADKFQNIYRIESARLQNWDYGWNASYFVTICTQNRECYFGDIVETQNFASPYKMQLSEIGKMAQKY